MNTKDGYVAFTADSQQNLEGFLTALPFMGPRMNLVGNNFTTEAIFIAASLNLDGHISYKLSVHGSPQHLQRALIGKIEESLQCHSFDGGPIARYI